MHDGRFVCNVDETIVASIAHKRAEVVVLNLSAGETEAWDKYSRALWTYHSSKIEGNPFSLNDVGVFVNTGLIYGQTLHAAQEIAGHLELLKDAEKAVATLTAEMSEDLIKRLHAALVQKDVGYRVENVGVVGQRVLFPEFISVPSLVCQFIEWLSVAETKGFQGRMAPLELAARAHLYFVCIHPFSDGNGRLARVLSNMLLQKHDYPAALIRAELQEEYFHCLMAGRRGDLSLLANLLGSSVDCGLHAKLEFTKYLRSQ
eukprot:TRINITY_DN6531_c0_g3_i1.p1 TRINITY_DN6531_c0_g3~~TRINITY_DN6531_c0_g3_i1.p1  ORF type:complete len:260 (-),score=51.54 TRINITY_DN6531_c0_g3_i1:59-838(-)